MGALRPLFPGVYGEQRLPKASVCISLRLEPPLAKVGVEGSNPFARSNYRDAKSRGKQRLFACSGMSEAKNFEGARRRVVTPRLQVRKFAGHPTKRPLCYAISG